MFFCVITPQKIFGVPSFIIKSPTLNEPFEVVNWVDDKLTPVWIFLSSFDNSYSNLVGGNIDAPPLPLVKILKSVSLPFLTVELLIS